MSATVLNFPGGGAIAEPQGSTVLRANAKQWLELSLQHQIGGSNAINAGDDSMAVAELTHAIGGLTRARTNVIESRGDRGDAKSFEIEALRLTLTSIAGELELLPTKVAGLTAHRLELQEARIDNVLARVKALVDHYRSAPAADVDLA